MTASAESAATADSPLIIDRYAIYDAIAAGGMATVHLGRLIGPAGFLRTVAVKRLHAQYAGDSDFTSMLLDEARLAARIQHPNVVSTLDVVVAGKELLLVMEYIRGESLARLVRRARERDERAPARIVVAILTNALHGLHAAHEATNERGQPLGLVHRDMSPQNILVGADGISRVLDFGIAKAEGRLSSTQDGKIKGKIMYMPPEQLAAEGVNRTADIYSVGVVLFEALTSVRMFAGENERAAISKIITGEIRVPSEIAPELAPFDAVVRRALALEPANRYATAAEMAADLDSCMQPAQPGQVGAWVQSLLGDVLDERARMVAEIERSSTRSKPPIALPNSGAMKIDVPTPSSVRDLAPATLPVPIRVPTPEPSSSRMLPPAPESSPRAQLITPPTQSPVVTGVMIGMGLLIVTFAIAGYWLSTRSPKQTATGLVASSVAALPDESSVALRIVRVPPTSVASAPPAESAAQTSAPIASAAPSASASVKGAGGTKPVYHSTVNCDPPYTIDSKGRQHFIPECMR